MREGVSLLRNLSARWVLEELSAQGRRRCYKGKKGGMGAKTETTVCRTQTNGRPPPPNRLLKRRGFESSDGGPLDSSCSFNTILRYSYQKMKTPRSARTPKGDERLLVELKDSERPPTPLPHKLFSVLFTHVSTEEFEENEEQPERAQRGTLIISTTIKPANNTTC